jgi:hypothetical protein
VRWPFRAGQDAKVAQEKGRCSALGSFVGSSSGPGHSQPVTTYISQKVTHALEYFEVTYATTFLDGFHLISSLGKVTLHPDPGLFRKFS